MQKDSAKRKNVDLSLGFPTFLLLCTPSTFQQINMYPFSISTDEYAHLDLL